MNDQDKGNFTSTMDVKEKVIIQVFCSKNLIQQGCVAVPSTAVYVLPLVHVQVPRHTKRLEPNANAADTGFAQKKSSIVTYVVVLVGCATSIMFGHLLEV